MWSGLQTWCSLRCKKMGPPQGCPRQDCHRHASISQPAAQAIHQWGPTRFCSPHQPRSNRETQNIEKAKAGGCAGSGSLASNRWLKRDTPQTRSEAGRIPRFQAGLRSKGDDVRIRGSGHLNRSLSVVRPNKQTSREFGQQKPPSIRPKWPQGNFSSPARGSWRKTTASIPARAASSKLRRSAAAPPGDQGSVVASMESPYHDVE